MLYPKSGKSKKGEIRVYSHWLRLEISRSNARVKIEKPNERTVILDFQIPHDNLVNNYWLNN
ncbi:hypothetical protein HanRHA438_Chr05g0207101 [Helianthus annuus]|nr:hypothetical protein HanRHA438_Chr05g0207101 [Helianthus annuus]